VGECEEGQALLDSWQAAASNSLAQIDNSKTWQAFAAKLEKSKAGFDSGGPLLLFTATAVDTGERVVFSNASDNAFSKFPIGVAALHSARFPFITPAGAILVDNERKWFADGGFFDNSGAETLRHMLIKAKNEGKLTEKVIVARINGNASSQGDTRCDKFYDAAAESKWFPAAEGFLKETPKKREKQLSDPAPWYRGSSAIDTYDAIRIAHAEESASGLETQMETIVDRVITPQLRLARISHTFDYHEVADGVIRSVGLL